MTKSQHRGFTLLETMIVVGIIGILTAVALPAYRTYVARSRVTDAFTALAGAHAMAPEYWLNNKSFANMPPPVVPATSDFGYVVSNDTVSTYTITATGTGQSAGYVYTINESGNRATVNTPSWGTSTSCWIGDKGGKCIQ